MNHEKLEKAQKLYSNAVPIEKVENAMGALTSGGIDPITASISGVKVGVVGGCARILFPNFNENEELVDLTGRRFDGKQEMKYFNCVSPKSTYFKAIDAAFALDALVVVEGQKDAIASYEIGMPAIALGGADAKGLNDLRCRNWLVYPDRDSRGAEIEQKIAQVALSRKQPLPVRIQFEVEGKDLSEHLARLKCRPLKEFFDESTIRELMVMPWHQRLYEFSKLTNTIFNERINHEIRSA